MPGTGPSSRMPATRGASEGSETAGPAAQVFVVSQGSLSSIAGARILGVVSRSPRTSIRLYQDADTYDTWLFYYGQDAAAHPDIVRLDRPGK